MIHGIDVSHHQKPETLDYRRIAKSQAFLIARATYGVRSDETFPIHADRWRSCQRRDPTRVFGAYHFFRDPRGKRPQPWEAQCEAFIAELRRVNYGEHALDRGAFARDLAPALDLEDNHRYDGPLQDVGAYVEDAARFLETLAVVYGHAFVYLAPGWFLGPLRAPDDLRRFLLWLADHRSGQQRELRDWPAGAEGRTGPIIHQYTDKATIPGSEFPLDGNHADDELPTVSVPTYAAVIEMTEGP